MGGDSFRRPFFFSVLNHAPLYFIIKGKPMIYIYKTDIEQTVIIPNASGTDNGIGAATFELTGAASGLPKVIKDATVASAWEGMYFRVTIAGMGIAPKGEFNFALKNGALTLAHGVARVIEWQDEPIEDGTSQNIIQYE